MALKGKTAIVTGGAQGIGRAIGLRLAKDGANIGILDIKKDVADSTAKEIGKLGVKGEAIECDVTDYDKVKNGYHYHYQPYTYLSKYFFVYFEQLHQIHLYVF